MQFTQAGTMDHRYEGLTGEPCAMKVASTVRRGAVGKGLLKPEQHLAGGLPYTSEVTPARKRSRPKAIRSRRGRALRPPSPRRFTRVGRQGPGANRATVP